MTFRDPLATVVRAISFKTGNFIISKKLNLPARDCNYEKKEQILNEASNYR